MSASPTKTKVSAEDLRKEVRKEYAEVALDPHKGYHFHTGRAAADRLGYDPALYAGLPEADLLGALRDAGFEHAEIVKKHDIFADVLNPSSALAFGTVGISLRANKLK